MTIFILPVSERVMDGDKYTISSQCDPDKGSRGCRFTLLYHPQDKKDIVSSIVDEETYGFFHPLYPTLVRAVSSARPIHFSSLCTPKCGYTVKVGAAFDDAGCLSVEVRLLRDDKIVPESDISVDNINLIQQAMHRLSMDIMRGDKDRSN